MAKRDKETAQESWFNSAARMIVRQNIPLRHACAELNVPLTSQECDKVFKSDAFQKILMIERNTFAKEIANVPGRDKTSAIGLLYYLIQKLIDEGEFDKAVVALEKLMKAEGWTGTEGNVNVFAGLSARDYSQLLNDLKDEDDKGPVKGKGSPSKSVQ